jgi:hypothetical protein
MNKSKLIAMIIALILISSLGPIINPVAGDSTPEVKVDPASLEYYTKATGKEFTIAVKIMNVTNLYGFDMELRWNTTFLEYVSHSVRVPKNTYTDGVLYNPTLLLADDVNATAGTYWIAYSSMDQAPSFNGTGTAFTMTFQVIHHPRDPEPTANITLELYSTDLADRSGDPIAHTAEHGTVILHQLPSISTTLSVQPTIFRRSQGVTIPLNVSIDDVTDLYAFDITINYNATLLEAISVAEGPFLKSIGNTTTIKSEINDTLGQVRFCLSLLGAPTGKNGSGTLFTITFKSSTTATGTSFLTLNNTELSDSTWPEPVPIDHAIIDGEVEVVLVEIITHEVVIGVDTYYFKTASSSVITNFQYDTNKNMSFDAEGPIDVLGFTNITLPKSLFDLPVGDAFLVLLDGGAMTHIRTENSSHYFLYFTYSHSVHKIEIMQTLISDLNGDRKVDIYDVVVVAVAYDATPSKANWNPIADIAQPKGKINIYDVVVVTRVYSKTWPLTP